MRCVLEMEKLQGFGEESNNQGHQGDVGVQLQQFGISRV